MIYGDGGHALVIKSFYQGGGTIVAIGDNADRKKEAERLEKEGHWFGTAIHPKAYIAPGVEIGDGTVIMAGVVIQPGAKIGRHTIINTGATLDHHCVIEDYVHIAPGAHLCGNVKVGEGTLVGVGVPIAPGAVIPCWSLVKTKRLEIETVSNHEGL